VDLTLVRYTLSLTPSERLEMLEKKDLAMLPVLKATLAERPQE